MTKISISKLHLGINTINTQIDMPTPNVKVPETQFLSEQVFKVCNGLSTSKVLRKIILQKNKCCQCLVVFAWKLFNHI